MKKLLINVPKGTMLSSYLMKYYVYAKITERDGMLCYKLTDLANPMETISYLITTFMLSDFSIRCNHGDYTFRVRS